MFFLKHAMIIFKQICYKAKKQISFWQSWQKYFQDLGNILMMCTGGEAKSLSNHNHVFTLYIGKYRWAKQSVKFKV